MISAGSEPGHLSVGFLSALIGLSFVRFCAGQAVGHASSLSGGLLPPAGRRFLNNSYFSGRADPMKMTFGLWFHAKKCLSETWDETRARKAREARQHYFALLGEGPYCFVEVVKSCVGVGFLDALLREHLSYTFQGRESGQMFLSMATRRQFEGDSDTVKSGTTYYFKPDGTSSIEWENCVPHDRSFVETMCNVEGNWEPYPEFGDYESITRESRWENKGVESRESRVFSLSTVSGELIQGVLCARLCGSATRP
jgi:hypothetical protein